MTTFHCIGRCVTVVDDVSGRMPLRNQTLGAFSKLLGPVMVRKLQAHVEMVMSSLVMSSKGFDFLFL